MFPLYDIDSMDSRHGWVHVNVDTPNGSGDKYPYDEPPRLLRLSRVLPMGASFPYDFAPIPRTRGAETPVNGSEISEISGLERARLGEIERSPQATGS